MLASSFYDLVLGIDVHFEMVPTPAPAPTPVPNPFTGLVFDPLGLGVGLAVTNLIGAATGAPFRGPVVYWGGAPATNTGTNAMHVPGHIIIPPGTAWAPFPKAPRPAIRPGDVVAVDPPVKPADDAVCIFGSKTVTVMGTSAVRLGDLALSCSEPVRLPSSVVMAVPKGAPILIGGPPALDLVAAALGSLRTRFVSDALHSLVSRIGSSRLRNLFHRGVCFLTGHPVDVAAGKVVTDAVDAELPGPLPLQVERVYSSAFAARPGPLGHGWSLSLDGAVWREPGKVVYLAEDGREVEFDSFDLPGRLMLAGDAVWNPIEQMTLRCLEDGRWEIESHDGVVREFSPVSSSSPAPPAPGHDRALLRRVRSRCRNHEVVYEHDAAGRLVRFRDGRGGVHVVAHDTEGRAVEETSPVGMVQRMRHDPEGNLVEAKGATRHVRFRHGGFHRVVEREEGGTTIRFEHDTEDRLVAVVNEVGERYGFELDEAGRVAAETGFDGRRRWFRRDALGQVTHEALPGGLQREMTYDPAGRLTSIHCSDGTSTSFEYRADGALMRARNQAADVVFERDVLGRIVSEQVDGVQVTSRYGADGARALVESSLGARQAIELDPLGDVAALHHGRLRGFEAPPVQRFERDALGLETARALPGGVRVSWRRDEAGRPVERRTWQAVQGVVTRDLGTVAFQWRGHDQIAALIDAARGPRFFDHDTRGRLTRERRPDRAVERAMDEVGNVFRRADRTDRRYGPGGRLEEADGTRYEHDEDGNLTLRSAPDGSVWRYAWDGAGMLREVERPDGVRVRFEYDPFARRTRKTIVTRDDNGAERVASDRRFVWDGHTVLHEIPAGDAPTTWYWEPGTFTPVAREHTGRHHSVASDHLGTPTEMYDESGTPTWQMHLDVLGSPTFDIGDPLACPWRWPGQYEDEETGLVYNRRRYYDTTSGSYSSFDPLRLSSSFSFYAYVPDPTLEIDPLGEKLVQTGVTASGESRFSRSWRARNAPGAMRSHHVVPQALLRNQDFYERLSDLGRDPADWVHRQIARVANGDHARIHQGGHYNSEWLYWLADHQRFDMRDLRQQMREMMRKYNTPRSAMNQPRYGRCRG